MPGPRATVVVVNWNGAHLLPACLDAVRAQDLPPDSFETWVVDNGSRDGSAELVRRDYPWVRLLQTGRNLGFAGGNNAALRQVTTPFAVLLNNDAVPEPDWLRQTLATFDAPGTERLGAVTPKTLFLDRYAPVRVTARPGVPIRSVTRDGEPVAALTERLLDGRSDELLVPVPDDGRHAVRITWTDGEVVDAKAEGPSVDVLNNAGGIVLRQGYGADRGFQEPDAGQYDEPAEVFTFCGNGVALRREVLQQVGLLDDDFFLYYEDTDLSWRVRAAGWSIRYQPAAVLRHHHSASTGEWSPLFTFHVDRNRLLLLTKNASAGLAARQVLRYPLTTASMALRQRRNVRPTLLRLRVIASYLRLLPRMLARRRAITASATVPKRELERWLVNR